MVQCGHSGTYRSAAVYGGLGLTPCFCFVESLDTLWSVRVSCSAGGKGTIHHPNMLSIIRGVEHFSRHHHRFHRYHPTLLVGHHLRVHAAYSHSHIHRHCFPFPCLLQRIPCLSLSPFAPLSLCRSPLLRLRLRTFRALLHRKGFKLTPFCQVMAATWFEFFKKS